MQRLRLVDLRLSRLPSAVGVSANDIPGIAQRANAAQMRLLEAKESGDEGWWGTWAWMLFNVAQSNPYLTCPRNVSRLVNMAVCQRPVPIQNQFYEYMDFGCGPLPSCFSGPCGWAGWPRVMGFSRNNVPLFTDLTNAPQLIQVFASNPSDMSGNSRVLIQGLDANSLPVYTLDGINRVQGQFVTLTSPFVTSPQTWSSITGIQKDITAGPVSIYQVDPVSGASILLLTMEPSETTANYRRYYVNNLPLCCPQSTASSGTPTVQISAVAKLDLVPVIVDTDYTLIQSMEAIIEECEALRYSSMDNTDAFTLAESHHTKAIGLLNGELTAHLGELRPAVNFKPFGSANLCRVGVGMM